MRTIPMLLAITVGALAAPTASADDDEEATLWVDAGPVAYVLVFENEVVIYREDNGCHGLQRERTEAALVCGGPDRRLVTL